MGFPMFLAQPPTRWSPTEDFAGESLERVLGSDLRRAPLHWVLPMEILGTAWSMVPAGMYAQLAQKKGTFEIGAMFLNVSQNEPSLVGGDWNMTFIFPYIGDNHPN